jgi:hypothetical protein
MDTDQKLALGVFCTILLCVFGCLAFSCRRVLLPLKSSESESQNLQEEQYKQSVRIL